MLMRPLVYCTKTEGVITVEVHLHQEETFCFWNIMHSENKNKLMVNQNYTIQGKIII